MFSNTYYIDGFPPPLDISLSFTPWDRGWIFKKPSSWLLWSGWCPFSLPSHLPTLQQKRSSLTSKNKKRSSAARSGQWTSSSTISPTSSSSSASSLWARWSPWPCATPGSQGNSGSRKFLVSRRSRSGSGCAVAGRRCWCSCVSSPPTCCAGHPSTASPSCATFSPQCSLRRSTTSRLSTLWSASPWATAWSTPCALWPSRTTPWSTSRGWCSSTAVPPTMEASPARSSTSKTAACQPRKRWTVSGWSDPLVFHNWKSKSQYTEQNLPMAKFTGCMWKGQPCSCLTALKLRDDSQSWDHTWTTAAGLCWYLLSTCCMHNHANKTTQK